MPPFESQAQRDKRILGRTSNCLINRICEVVDDIHYRSVYCAWFAGAASLATIFVGEIECTRRLWGKGDDHKAMSLFEVCVCPMMSIWFRQVEKPKEVPKKVKLQGKKNAISNVLDLIGSYSEERLRDSLNLDIQYNYEQDFAEARKNTGREGISTWYASLLIARIKEAWGPKRILDWGRQNFPIRQSSDYAFTREASLVDLVESTNTSIIDLLTLSTLWISLAGCDMFDLFNALNE